jgi:hypothetical protein
MVVALRYILANPTNATSARHKFGVTQRRSVTLIEGLAQHSIVAMSAAVASAQKVKAGGPPATTHGEIKANPNAASGQANAEGKRTDAADDKAARAADKKEDNAERTALKAAHAAPNKLLKDIKLSDAEKKSVADIEKGYDAQLKELDKQEDAAEKAGKPDATIASKIDALRTQEAAALRGVLSPDQQKQFDKNAASIGSKK